MVHILNGILVCSNQDDRTFLQFQLVQVLRYKLYQRIVAERLF